MNSLSQRSKRLLKGLFIFLALLLTLVFLAPRLIALDPRCG
jgi:hypothetical protein